MARPDQELKTRHCDVIYIIVNDVRQIYQFFILCISAECDLVDCTDRVTKAIVSTLPPKCTLKLILSVWNNVIAMVSACTTCQIVVRCGTIGKCQLWGHERTFAGAASLVHSSCHIAVVTGEWETLKNVQNSLKMFATRS